MKKHMGTGLAAVALVALLVVGLGTESAVRSTASADSHQNVAYAITVENLTSGQPLTPPVAATHSDQIDALEVGQTASEELREVAENGNSDPIVALLSGSDAVYDVTTGEGPILPGASGTLTVEAPPGAVLTLVSMLICTNDGFTGLDSYGLPDSGSVSVDVDAYDAGTEENSEASADLVDPCGAAGPVELPEDGNARTPTSDVIAPHPGIQGAADLTVSDHGWTDPVARITISAQAPAGLPTAGSGGFLGGDESSTPWALYLGIAGAVLLLAGGGAYAMARRKSER